jgi:hypothetical protein
MFDVVLLVGKTSIFFRLSKIKKITIRQLNLKLILQMHKVLRQVKQP